MNPNRCIGSVSKYMQKINADHIEESFVNEVTEVKMTNDLIQKEVVVSVAH